MRGGLTATRPLTIALAVAVALACAAQPSPAEDWISRDAIHGITTDLAARTKDFGKVRDSVVGAAHGGETVELLKDYPARDRMAEREAEITTAVGGQPWRWEHLQIMSDVVGLGITRVDLWHGSHVVVKGDGGRNFQTWAGMALVVKSRTSSHYKGSPHPQFELAFGRHGFLFGRTPEGDTWFQMENHSGAGVSIQRSVGHVGDYMAYAASKMNIGPLGRSPFTEKNPIVRALVQPAASAR